MIAVILALVAAVLLAVGYLADAPVLGWAALATSLGALVLVLLPLARRVPADRPDVEPVVLDVESDVPDVEPVETTEPAADLHLDKLDVREAVAPDVESFETVAAQPPQEPPAETTAPVLADDLVLVVPGRRRYHRPGCELVADREVEKLTEDEAREEGFSACTRCHS